MPKLKHLLCYCRSLPSTPCDYCSGMRHGTEDDYRSLLASYRLNPVYDAAPDLRKILADLLRAVQQRHGYATAEDTWPEVRAARKILAQIENGGV